MLFSSFLVALAAVPFALASEKKELLDKPAMKPPLPQGMKTLNPALLANLPTQKQTHDKWGPGWIPARCKEEAIKWNFRPSDMEAWNVNYKDCGSPWVICRHKKAQMSKNTMISQFGRLPVRMRDYVQHLIALPGGGENARSGGDSIVFLGSCGMTVFVHEIAHCLDRIGIPDKETRLFSSSKLWLTEYAKDTAVVGEYARTDHGENFADEVVAAFADKNIPGGIGTITPAWNQIFHQYATIQWKLGDKLVQGGTCNRKFQNSPPVANTRRRGLVQGPPPAYLVEGDHDFIDPATLANLTSIRTSFDEHGNAFKSVEAV